MKSPLSLLVFVATFLVVITDIGCGASTNLDIDTEENGLLYVERAVEFPEKDFPSMGDRSIDVDQPEQQEASDEENRDGCSPAVWGCPPSGSPVLGE